MKALLIALALALAGCATTAPETVEVKVPVYKKLDIPEVEKPSFAFDSLDYRADIYQQVKALLADREQRKAYQLKLEGVLNSLRQ